MISRTSILFLFRSIISVASLSFLRKRLSSERKHLSIHDLTASTRNNSSCVLGIKMSDSDNVLMAGSSIWWFFLSDSTNALCAWEFLMVFQVWINILDNPHSTNSEVHDHDPCAIFLHC